MKKKTKATAADAKVLDLNNINNESLAYVAIKPTWYKVSPLALTGHTDEMRANRELFLPKEELEDDDNYAIRLTHSFLYGAYRDTIEKCVAKPFSREIVVDHPTEKSKQVLANANGSGKSLSDVAKQFFAFGVNYGVAHLLVDLPKKPIEPGVAPTLADDLKVTPTFTAISPYDLIWWHHEKDPQTGALELTEIHIRDTIIKSDTTTYVDTQYVRVTKYTKTSWEIYLAESGGKFELDSSGAHSFGRVPLFSWFANEELSPFVTKPPLLELADLNIAHWQSSSQQRNYLRFIRIGFLFIAGITEDDLVKQGGTIRVGPTNVLATENPNAKADYLEHKGTAFDSGIKDLDRLEQQMTIMGLQPFIEKASGDPTATGRSITEAKHQSRLQMWCKHCSTVLTDAVAFGLEASNDEVDPKFAVNIYSDFGISVDNIQKVDKLFQAHREKAITTETLLRELQRYGIVSEKIDPEVEVETAAEEAKVDSLNSLGIGGDPAANDPNLDENGQPKNAQNPAVPLKKNKKPQPFQVKKAKQ